YRAIHDRDVLAPRIEVVVVRPLVVIDAANVMGSTPDGWWRDRRAAAERLRDRLDRANDVALAEAGIAVVVEGKAKGIQSTQRVRVHDAPASGDDAIVELVRAAVDRPVTVVTADRGLRERVKALGAALLGPRALDM